MDSVVGCSVVVVVTKLGRNSKEGKSMVDGEDDEDVYEDSEWGGVGTDSTDDDKDDDVVDMAARDEGATARPFKVNEKSEKQLFWGTLLIYQSRVRANS